MTAVCCCLAALLVLMLISIGVGATASSQLIFSAPVYGRAGQDRSTSLSHCAQSKAGGSSGRSFLIELIGHLLVIEPARPRFCNDSSMNVFQQFCFATESVRAAI